MKVEVTALRGHPVPEGQGVRNVVPGETYETTLTKARALKDLGYVVFDEPEPETAKPADKPK